MHSRAAGLGAEACVGEGAPITLPHLFPQPQPPLPPNPLSTYFSLKTLQDPETLTNSWERWVEAARDRPRDMSTASEVAERADTQGHTHGYTLTWGHSPGWRLRRGQSCVGGLKDPIPGARHSLFSEMGRHRRVAGVQSYKRPVLLTVTTSKGAPTTSLEVQPGQTVAGGVGAWGALGEEVSWGSEISRGELSAWDCVRLLKIRA